MATTQEHVLRIIDAHLDELRQPGVLSVRPGFLLQDDWITDTRAIVVTVARSTDVSSAGLPREIDSVPVDIRTASPAKLAQLATAARAADTLAADPESTGPEKTPGVGEATAPESAAPAENVAGPENNAGPEIAERPTTWAAASEPAPDQGGVAVFSDEKILSAPLISAMLERVLTPLAKPTKPQLTYSPPEGVALAPVTATIRIELSASPDSGWSVLKEFLAGTEKSLTIGLYDFTSAHVLTEFESAMSGKPVSLVLDHPAKNPTADQTDDQTVADLDTALGSEFDQVWALERSDPHAAAWIFPSAYHIKTAVRDSNAVWLSSGNWNNSNQPDIDPVHNPADAAEARIRDRDWHVVIHDVALAKVFESHLLNDHAVAAQHQVAAAAAEEQEPASAEAMQLLQPLAQTPPFTQFTDSTTLREEMTITPVLTPDAGVYVDAVRALIESAQTSLHMQFQYIEPPSKPSSATAPFSALIDAVIARQKAGVDVKVIMSQYETSGYLEQLQQLGMDVVNGAKLQNNVHNKGIVVDGTRTLVSSQNWSGAGTLQNRDAGVIIDSARVAAYFDAIFQHDWDNLARQKVLQD
ncbi:phospholipase D-like domain-containing protein [Humibacter soli]